MNQNNNVLRKYDYEKYEVQLPFSAAFGKRRKRFLCSELEKMHPCFSDEFTFDSVFKGINHKGINEDVFVINKMKLAEYEAKRRFEGSGFSVEQSENSENPANTEKRCFCHRQYRLFMNFKWKLTIWTCLACLLVGSTGVVCGALVSRENMRSSENSGMPEAAVEETKSKKPEKPAKLENPIETAFFENISSAKGKIASFDWKLQGFSKTMNAFVKGVYPEMLFAAAGKNVVYENGVPQMKISCEQTIKGSVVKDQKTEPFMANQILRELISDAGGVLLEENISPYHIEFSCRINPETEKMFEKLESIIREQEMAVSQLSINQNGNGELRTGLSLERIPFSEEGFDLKLLAENLQLFSVESGRKSAKKTSTASEVLKKEQPRPESRQKLGEIKRPDNSLVVFYKNSEGKMEVEK